MTWTLRDFVKESNRIEGIVGVKVREIKAHETFLALDEIKVQDLKDFVRAVEPGAYLRVLYGCNVWVGIYKPPVGGPGVRVELERILGKANSSISLPFPASPYEVHVAYENLHPFTDGNGRSGRVLWLWMMSGMEKVPLGFLHQFYYQTLEASGR